MKPPAFPIMSRDYDPDQLNRFIRTLTQYLTQESIDEAIVEQEADVNEVLIWIGGF